MDDLARNVALGLVGTAVPSLLVVVAARLLGKASR